MEYISEMFTFKCNTLQIRQRDETIKQLQEDLMESQAQYSTCYNEVRTN